MGNCTQMKDKLHDSFTKICNSSKKIHIQIIKPVINKENLLDLEDKCLISEKFMIPLSSFLQKGHQEVLSCKIDEEKTLHFKINNRKLCIDYLSSKNEPPVFLDNRCWIVLNERFFSNYRISLSKGDVLKLGKLVFSISDLEIVNPKKKSAKLKLESSKKIISKTLQNTSLDKSNTCKYCLEEDRLEDPLITPCKCAGSMAYVHLNCMQKWAKEKVTKVENDYITINTWDDLVCDLCKCYIPSLYKHNGTEINLLKGERPDFSFIEMETLIETKHYVFYINLDKQNSIKMGRYIDCEIRLNEISVSRHHTKLYMENNEIFIEDMGSKYGTLLLYKEPLTMENILMENEELCLQHCGFLMKFSLKNNKESTNPI